MCEGKEQLVRRSDTQYAFHANGRGSTPTSAGVGLGFILTTGEAKGTRLAYDATGRGSTSASAGVG